MDHNIYDRLIVVGQIEKLLKPSEIKGYIRVDIGEEAVARKSNDMSSFRIRVIYVFDNCKYFITVHKG